MAVIPTAILLAVAVFAALRARCIASLRTAAWALGALFVLDTLHHAAEPIADIWRHGGALAPWQTWALRGDAWIVAGAWPGVCAQLAYASEKCRRPLCYCVVALFALYGMWAVDMGRATSAETWTALLIAPRLAVGLIAGAAPKARSPSLLIGKIIAACQVAAAFFLWRHWSDVRLLSSACWLACGWVVWRTSASAVNSSARSS